MSTQDGAKLADELEYAAQGTLASSSMAVQSYGQLMRLAAEALRHLPAAAAQGTREEPRAVAKITGVGMDGVRFTAECIHGELKVGQLLYAAPPRGTREQEQLAESGPTVYVGPVNCPTAFTCKADDRCKVWCGQSECAEVVRVAPQEGDSRE